MSESPSPLPASPPPQRRHPVVILLMILAGLILLLPGICSGVFMVISISEGGGAGGFFPLWLLCFAVSAAGILLIVNAIRGPKPGN